MKRIIAYFFSFFAVAGVSGQKFEEYASENGTLEKPKVEVGGDFALQFQFLKHHASNNHLGSLYLGDRTGSRYYLVMNRINNDPDDVDPSENHLSGNWGPGFTDRDNSFMLNLFTKYKGLEFFGTFENVKGTTAFGGTDFIFTQYALETLLHFGKDEKFFGGIRFNYTENNSDDSIFRIQIGCGWFLIPNVLIKAEYVDQNYNNFIIYGNSAGFNGIMIESTVSF